MSHADLEAIGNDVAKALSRSRVRNSSVFVATPIVYPNGTGVAVKIDQGKDGYVITDDGYAEVIAEDMGALSAMHRVATGVALRAGLKYERGTFSIEGVERNVLHVAVASVANASAQAVERTLASVEKPRLTRSREVFDKRLKEAFGDAVSFDVEHLGATGRRWDFSAGVSYAGTFERLFELVSPSIQAVGIANMKISDVRSMTDPPTVTAALIDYDKTDPTLRSILSNAGSLVIAASDDVQKYRLLQ